MAGDTISISFKCGECGTTVEWPDDAVESTKLTCVKCGDDLGTYGELHAKGMAAARNKVEQVLKDAFRGL